MGVFFVLAGASLDGVLGVSPSCHFGLRWCRDFRISWGYGLQNLAFGESFDHSLDQVALPSGLQNLTFGECYNQSLEQVALPSGCRWCRKWKHGGRFEVTKRSWSNLECRRTPVL